MGLAGLVARARVAGAWASAWAGALVAARVRPVATRAQRGLGHLQRSVASVVRSRTPSLPTTAPGLRAFAGRRLGVRGAWVVAISGVAGVAAGAVSSTVYASPPTAKATDALASSALAAAPDPTATIPAIVATGGEASTAIETVQVPLEPESIRQTDKYLPVGYTKVLSKGDPGLQLAMYSVTSVDGVETHRDLLASFVVKEPTHDVVSVGALVVPARGAIVPGSTRDIGKQIAASWGWTDIEWLCLDNLFARESGWRTDADNPNSSAYGIPQALPGSKMASAGADWATNPATQITWGLGYIKGRYGTPCGAWGKWSERSPHWY